MLNTFKFSEILTLGFVALAATACNLTQSESDKPITGARIENGSVNAEDLAAGAVSTASISDDSITDAHIATNAVTTTEITDATISATDLAGNAVTTAKILDGTIIAGDLAADAVTTAKILDATIAAADLAADAVTSAKILDSTIVSADIFDGTIATADIADAGITPAKLTAAGAAYQIPQNNVGVTAFQWVTIPSIRDSARDLIASTASVTQVQVNASEMILQDTLGNPLRVTTVAETGAITVVGAGGLDAGAEAISTWYYYFVISDGTNVDLLLSISPTAPTMPGAYTFKALVGAVYNDSAGNFVTFAQTGRQITYATPVQVLSTAAATTSAWTAFAITTGVPVAIAKTVTFAAGSMGANLGIGGPLGAAGFYSNQAASATVTGMGIFALAWGNIASGPVKMFSPAYYFTDTANLEIVVVGFEI